MKKFLQNRWILSFIFLIAPASAHATSMEGLWVVVLGFYAILLLGFGLIWMAVSAALCSSKKSPKIWTLILLFLAPVLIMIGMFSIFMSQMYMSDWDYLLYLIPFAVLSLALAWLFPIRALRKARRAKSAP